MPDQTFWPFPWDTRVRPPIQLGISVLQLGGKRGGEVKLLVSWRLMTDKGRTLKNTGEFATKHIAGSDSYEAYVAAIKLCFDDLATYLARQISGERISET